MAVRPVSTRDLSLEKKEKRLVSLFFIPEGIEFRELMCLLQVARRQRVDFVSGQHHLAHFPQGKDTPTTNVLQVRELL